MANQERAFAELDQAIAAASASDRPALVVALAARLAVVGAGLATTGDPSPARDTSLTVDEGARRLGVSKAWIYHNIKTLPFATRIGRRLVLSERGIDRYMERLWAGRC